jgi:FixJ family two-component response regulator
MQADTVFIIDDDASVRDAMSLLLSLKGRPSATFASAEDFLAAWQPHWRGCVVADIRMSGMSGLELQALLRGRQAPLPVIVITAHGDVAAARQAFLNQAVDFIEKPFDGDTLLAAIERAGSRRPVPAAQPIAPGDDVPDAAVPAGTGTVEVMLSPREYEVMQLLTKGLHNRRIAAELGISHRTVEVHKARVFAKLGVRSVVELLRLIDNQPPR